jgi:outer membrane protein TolC
MGRHRNHLDRFFRLPPGFLNLLMKGLVHAAIFAFCIFSAPLVHAQDANASRNLSLEQALELARNNTENLDAPRTRIASVRARLRAIGAMPAPELRLRHDEGRLAGESSQEYALRFRLNNPWETKALVEEGQARTEVARIQLKLTENILSNEIKRLYFETLYRKKDALLAHKIAETQAAIRTAHDILVAEGQLTLPKALESRLGTYETLAEASKADRTYESVSSTLLALLDQPDDTPVNLVTSFSKPDKNTSNLTLNNLFSTAILGRPELISLEHEGETARARIHQAEARRIPWFSFLQGNIEHDRRISSDSDQWGVLLGIEIPMWGHRADIQAATAELHENLAIQRLARRDLRLTLATALRNYRAASQQLAEHENSSVNLESELAPALEESPNGQGIDPVSRNLLRIGLFEVRRKLLEARYQFQSAHLALELAIGHPLRKEVFK